jgi:hypothetical protein
MSPYDPMAAFVTDWSSADIIAEYRELSARSDAVLAVTPLSARPRGGHGDPEVAELPTVRWVVLHVIEETARHAGRGGLRGSPLYWGSGLAGVWVRDR